MAALSRLDLSELQIAADFESNFFIFVYAPFCIMLGLLATLKFTTSTSNQSDIDNENKTWNIIFYTFIILFLSQFSQGLPPALSSDPMNNRLTWGVKYVHVLTEVVFRITLVLCLGSAINRGKFLKRDLKVILPVLIYSLLVVSRGLVIEIVFYVLLASIFIHSKKHGMKLKLSLKHYITFGAIWVFFISYGQWRQGSDFNIAEYGKMRSDNAAVSWIFGYFLVNFDNLTLIISQKFQNNALTNVFGPLLQTLQINQYYEVNDYLYVGRFNLGTALRSYVMDFGPWWGGFVFSAVWIFWLKILDFCTFLKSKFTILLLITYAGFCFPITGRLEEPTYLIPLFVIFILDIVGGIRLRRKLAT